MQMKDIEILGSYRRADDKKAQVQILAELNGCDKETIQRILIDGGISESEFATKKKPGRKKKINTTSIAHTDGQPTPIRKPNPAEAIAPDEEEPLLIPFSDDDMGSDDEYNSGAITGGEGIYNVAEDPDEIPNASISDYHRYRNANELLEEPDDMTGREKERLARIKAIPNIVRDLCKAELRSLREEVMLLEKKADIISDYLNGESE